jgi:hypothetical protein
LGIREQLSPTNTTEIMVSSISIRTQRIVMSPIPLFNAGIGVLRHPARLIGEASNGTYLWVLTKLEPVFGVRRHRNQVALFAVEVSRMLDAPGRAFHEIPGGLSGGGSSP